MDFQVTASGVGCEMCPELCEGRKQIVEGVGPHRAKLMVIAEAPGREEDEYGAPFVGQSGTLLHATLSELGLMRADYYCTNTVRCRPPGNRDPSPEELENCRFWLLEEIARVNPENILLLGKIAASQRKYIEQEFKGSIYEAAHPAYLLRFPAKRPEWKRHLGEILEKVGGVQASQVGDGLRFEPPVAQWARGTPDVAEDVLAVDIETDDLEEGYGTRTVTVQLASADVAQLYEPVHHLALPQCGPIRLRVSQAPGQDQEGASGGLGSEVPAGLAEGDGREPHLPHAAVRELATHHTGDTSGEHGAEPLSSDREDGIWWDANARHHFYANVKYDGPRIGLDLYDFSKWDDIQLVAYVLREPRVGLKEIGPKYTGIPMASIKTILGTGKNQRPFSQALREDYARAEEYALKDGIVTARLVPILWERLRAEPILWRYYHEMEKPVVPVVAKLEQVGVQVDPDRLVELCETLTREADRAVGVLEGLLGPGTNWNSPRQVARTLIENGFKLTSKTKTGQISIDKAALLGYLRVNSVDELDLGVPTHQVVQTLLHYKTMVKLRSTYVAALLARRDSESRVHARFNQMVTDTSRFSSSEPNLQNIPIRNPLLGKAFRRVFVARPGHVLVKADFSQLELRIYAHYTREPLLLAAYCGPVERDVHQDIADEFSEFGVPRWRAKNGIFAAIYQAEAAQLARTFGIPPENATDFLKALRHKLPSLGGIWKDSVAAELVSCGYVETLYGWRNYYPMFFSPLRGERNEALRAAANMPIQGTAGGVLKKLLVAVDSVAAQNGAALVLTVHDEVVYEVPEGNARGFGRELEKIGREVAPELSVPLRLDVQIGPDWGTLTELDKYGR